MKELFISENLLGSPTVRPFFIAAIVGMLLGLIGASLKLLLRRRVS